MKNVRDMISRINFNKQAREEESQVLTEHTALVVNSLFKELQAIFPAFRQAWSNAEDFNNAKKSWVKAFLSVNLNSIEQIQFGINKCRLSGNVFAPSVGIFIKWCNPTPDDLGLPEEQEAYRISLLINTQFSDYHHPDDRVNQIIRHVIKQIGGSSYRSMTEENSRKIFRNYYPLAIKQFISGEFKIIPIEITQRPEAHPSDKARSDEARKKCMETLKSFGLGSYHDQTMVLP